MKEQLLGPFPIGSLPDLGGKPVLLEASHFYANQELGLEQEMAARVAKAALEALEELGLEVTPCLLIDNYHAEDTESEANLAQLGEWGFVPEKIYWEADSVGRGLSLLTDLEALGKVKDRKGAGKNLKEPWLPLLTSRGKLSCALLDAALYLEKHEQFGGICLTVLPVSFKSQQDNTRAILKVLDYQIPILNVYFDSQGEISVDFDF